VSESNPYDSHTIGFDPLTEQERSQRTQTDEKREAIRDERFLKLMAKPEFRDFMWDLLSASGLFRTSYSTDPGATEFNEGQRNLGLRYLSKIERLCPEHFSKMMIESQQEHSENAAS
jgi:hypothetical protein